MTDRPALVQRVLGGAAVAVLDRLPVPLAVARVVMLAENAVENARGGWDRLRDAAEADRYRAVREAVERHAPDGFVLDVGCSQGILREGLRYRRYVGVDRYAPALQRARPLSARGRAGIDESDDRKPLPHHGGPADPGAFT